MRIRRSDAACLAAGAAGTWLGLQAVRSNLAMVVWNVAEDAPANVMGGVAGAVWLVGLLGWLPARLVGVDRAPLVLATFFASASALRAVAVLPGLTPALAFAACIAWLWWLPSWWRAAMAAGRTRLLAPSIALGVLLQQAAQAALHGLDLHVLVGWPAALATALVALGFVAAVRLERLDVCPDGAEPGHAAGAAAVGPYLFLQMTLLANPSRISLAAAIEPGAAALIVLVGLLSGLALSGWHGSRWLGLVTLLALGLLERQDGVARAALVFAAQATATAALGWASRSAWPGARRVHPWFAGGALAMFVMIFAFYSRIDWPWVWVFAAGAFALLALSGRGEAKAPSLPALAGGATVASIGVVLGLIPYGPAKPRSETQGLTVLDYNIHQGFDARSLPGIQALAAFIESTGADIVTLQEVNRGMNTSGGVDYLAWLSWRLPQYHLVYGPMHGALYGNAILSRFPVTAHGWQRFDAGLLRLPRGFLWVQLATPLGDLTAVTAHLAPYEHSPDKEERVLQAQALTQFLPRARVVLAGDLNDEPESEPVRLLLRTGLSDSVSHGGLGHVKTFPSRAPVQRIDYVLLSPDLNLLNATIPEILTSDHRPLLVRFSAAP